MEIEQHQPTQQLVSQRHYQSMNQFNDQRRGGTQEATSLDNSVSNLLNWLETNYKTLEQICSTKSASLSSESQEQILIRNLKESFNLALLKNNMHLNFFQQDVKPSIMERVILSINQLSHLTTININLSRQNWSKDQVQFLSNQLVYCRQLKDFDLDLGFNCVSDRGNEILSETLSNMESLERIKINLERNGLQHRSISILEIFNKLKHIQYFSLNLNGNNIEIEDEMKILLPKFRSENIFAAVKSIEILFNEYQCKKSSGTTLENRINNVNHNQSNQNLDSQNYHNLVGRNQINQSNPQEIQNSMQNQLNSAQQQQQLQHLQQSIMQQQQQLVQFQQYAQQMLSRGYPQNHPQYIQVLTQMQQLQNSIQQNIQHSKNIAKQATALKKKSVISRLLEIMLKFTHNLEQFSFSCPGQLIDSACWEYFAELLKIKAHKLVKFHFAGLNSNTKNQDMEYFFYQMAKLKNLNDFSLSLHNLSTPNSLHLERFLKSLNKLEKVQIDLSSPDSFSNQKELYKDLSNFIRSTESTNIRELDLNISNSQIDNEIALNLFQGIAKMKNLTTLKLNLSSCEHVNDKTILILCEALLYQKNIKNIQINLAQSSFTPISIQNIMKTLALMKDSLISLQLNLTNRGESFINFNNNIINDTVSQLTHLKKCVISSIRNPKIKVYREKAEQVNRMIKMCQQVKNSNSFSFFRKEIALEALQFLIQ